MHRAWGVIWVVVLALVALVPATPGSAATDYGFVQFPRDEHGHVDGWDFWWGAAEVTAESGNSYIVGIAFDSLHGYGLTGHQIYPRQGPYAGRSIMTADGPKEWGHEGGWEGRIHAVPSFNNPLVEQPPVYRTFDAEAGFKDIGHWERTSLDAWDYNLRLDNDTAWVHPTGEHVKAVVNLKPRMKSPPLLAGGTGQWWYGIPETFNYPSRSYQYMQGAQTLTGTLDIEQPDGSVLRERVDPKRSRMLMIREYDASPEDLYAGLALAEGTQLHPSYAQYYHAGMPWELIFMDLDNGAQLMLGVLAFHETEQGTIAPVIGPDQPTYGLLATLRLPDGRSVVIPEDQLNVEHLNYKTIIGRVPTFWVAIHGVWRQSWDYRVSFDGGTLEGPDGEQIDVPAFDLGLEPEFGIREPAVNAAGDGPTQRIPYRATGSFDGCPVGGFGWSELIINWYGNERRDPWYTGGNLPGIPKRCGAKPGRERDPGRGDPSIGGPPSKNPNTAESCGAYNPGQPSCEYVAKSDGGISGYGSAPAGWTVKITRPGVSDPIVIPSLGGVQTYQCGTILPGDTVLVKAEPGSGVMVGNPGFCFESEESVPGGGGGGGTSTASDPLVQSGGDPAPKDCSIAINGNRGDNLLRGGATSEELRGRGGNDRVRGGGGNDCVSGNAGGDRLSGGSGADRIWAGRGSDRVRCGGGRDEVYASRRDRVAADCELIA